MIIANVRLFNYVLKTFSIEFFWRTYYETDINRASFPLYGWWLGCLRKNIHFFLLSLVSQPKLWLQLTWGWRTFLVRTKARKCDLRQDFGLFCIKTRIICYLLILLVNRKEICLLFKVFFLFIFISYHNVSHRIKSRNRI